MPGHKRGHARGVAFHGRFTPAPEVAARSTAELFHADRIDVVVRLSNGGSSPCLADRVDGKRGNPWESTCASSCPPATTRPGRR